MTGGGDLVTKYLREIADVDTIRIEHDAPTALAGGTGGGPGVVVIAGTGSAAFGMDQSGRRVSVGGWGYVMGDEGSGNDIALRALRAATSAADGRLPATALVRAIPAHFGVEDLRALHRLDLLGRIERPRLAEIARVVGEVADAGDLPARAILNSAAVDLAIAATAAISQLGALDRELPVVYAGGVFRAGRPRPQAVRRRARDARAPGPGAAAKVPARRRRGAPRLRGPWAGTRCREARAPGGDAGRRPREVEMSGPSQPSRQVGEQACRGEVALP